MISSNETRLLRAIDAVGLDLTSRDAWRRDWNERGEHDLWINLAACILGSQVRSEDAIRAAGLLSTRGLLTAIDRDWDRYETDVRRSISGQIADTGGATVRGLRFSADKARYVRGAAEWIVESGGSIGSILKHYDSATSARKELVRFVPGLGYKQASLFLRNVGFASEFAILDSHILRFMRDLELTSEATARTPAQYLRFETVLAQFATARQMPMHIFDVAVWIVMRVLAEPQASVGAAV